MSLLNGDRARAHKVDRKRRFRRSEIRLLRQVPAPTLDARVDAAVMAELPIDPAKLTGAIATIA
jgi:hypothetical protein